jgi:ribose-phosphate pyrophosphokinase
MNIVDLNKGQGVKTILFPDNQPHVTLELPNDLGTKLTRSFEVICSITSAQKLLELCEVAEAIEHTGGTKKLLKIPYLMASRYDRHMVEGDSFDLKVVANIINSLNFESVLLFDTHSDVSSALIERSKVITNRRLVEEYKEENAVLIVPDAGAAKKADKYREWNDCIKDEVYCIKHRDEEGNIRLKVIEPEKCTDRNCVVIDDLCDGGRTFVEIAKQIKPKHLTLMITHAIFSKGIDELKKYYQQIITTDSYNHTFNSKIIKQISYDN